MLILLIINALLLVTKSHEVDETSDDGKRSGKALSLFQIVRFPNVACSVSSSLNGTCYTASECANKGGVNSGSCASGFGACCTFTLGCGSMIAENCTYFQSASPAAATGQCAVRICKYSSDICQIRMDFNTFVITGPSTVTLSQVRITNGVAVSSGASGIGANYATSCLTDTFSVTGTGQSPPVICGINTGYHMYTDASDSCNTLSFQLGPTGIGTTVANRQWNIKITQISCLSEWLAPPGCTQYFTGTTNKINSYNYLGGSQLANQQQNICMRRERGYCRLCVTTAGAVTSDFQISSKAASGFMSTKCCGYGVDGAQTNGYDCLVLPGAAKMVAPFTHVGNGFCGKFLVDGTSATISATICTHQQPFSVQFLTDAYTFATMAPEILSVNPAGGLPPTPAVPVPGLAGFNLLYFETAC